MAFSTRIIVPILFVSLVSAYSQAGLNEGLTAYAKADYPVALKTLQPLAEKGDGKAQNLIGKMYYLGQGVAKDQAKGAQWFRKAAENGVPEAQGMLGYMHLVGEAGALLDMGLAQEWMTKAANGGDVGAQYNLGVMYGGNGVKEDPPKAAYWMRKAAEQGHKFALSNLALMYREGKGVAKDLTVAHMLYGLSGKAGNIDALKIQKEISAKMSSSQIRKSNKLAESWKIGAALPVR